MKHVLMIVGIGGMGILTAGRIVAEAGMRRYGYATWFPSYDARQRGGSSECTVVISDNEICSPVTLDTDAIIMMDVSQVAAFRDLVIPGGLVVAEKGCLFGRSDIREVEVPGAQIATRLGSVTAANQVFIGAYVSASKCLLPEDVDAVLEQRYKGRERVSDVNRKAFWEGVRLIESV